MAHKSIIPIVIAIIIYPVEHILSRNSCFKLLQFSHKTEIEREKKVYTSNQMRKLYRV